MTERTDLLNTCLQSTSSSFLNAMHFFIHKEGVTMRLCSQIPLSWLGLNPGSSAKGKRRMPSFCGSFNTALLDSVVKMLYRIVYWEIKRGATDRIIGKKESQCRIHLNRRKKQSVIADVLLVWSLIFRVRYVPQAVDALMARKVLQNSCSMRRTRMSWGYLPNKVSYRAWKVAAVCDALETAKSWRRMRTCHVRVRKETMVGGRRVRRRAAQIGRRV